MAHNGLLAGGGLEDPLEQPARLLNSSLSERVPLTSQCRQDEVAAQREEATLRAQRLTGSLSQVAVEQLTGTSGGDTSDKDECAEVRCRYGSGVVGFGSPFAGCDQWTAQTFCRWMWSLFSWPLASGAAVSEPPVVA